MGLVEDLSKRAGSVGDWVAKNPQAVSAVVSMLSTKDTSVGGSGGLDSIIDAFQQKGMGDMMKSWISTGRNPPISASQLQDVLGGDILAQFAGKTGLPSGQAGSALAALLPAVIDQLTPKGQVPDAGSLESTLGALLKGLGH